MADDIQNDDERSLLAIAGILDDGEADDLRSVIEERRAQQGLLTDRK